MKKFQITIIKHCIKLSGIHKNTNFIMYQVSVRLFNRNNRSNHQSASGLIILVLLLLLFFNNISHFIKRISEAFI